jgi:hypothetical protein
MKLVTQVMLNRLTAARVRLLDVYGAAEAISPLLSPLLTEARATWSGPGNANAGASGPGAANGEATDAGGIDAAGR